MDLSLPQAEVHIIPLAGCNGNIKNARFGFEGHPQTGTGKTIANPAGL